METETNIVYGMVSGLALLLDAHRPDHPNGYGIVGIPGCGWHQPAGYDARPLKEDEAQIRLFVHPLAEAGYVVFVVNHRGAPRFRYPVPLDDVRRAIRYVRRHAACFGIRPDRLGAVGAYAGGHLASMLGVEDGDGDPETFDEVERESARVQAVVAFCPPTDLTDDFSHYPATVLGSFLGTAAGLDPNSPEGRLYRQASPVTHVTPRSAPHLLIHGDRDDIVPFDQSVRMERALREAKVPARLIRLPGAGHAIAPDPGYPDYTGEMIRWFDRYLRNREECRR